MAVGEAICRWAHRTVRCASHVIQPLGFDRWSSVSMGHWTVRWCTGQSLFNVRCAFWRCSDFCVNYPHTVHTLFTHCSPFADDSWRCSRYSAWHTGQSSATLDSLVNYSGVALQKPEPEQFRVDLPGAPDTVRWHTGQFGAPDQGILLLVLLLSF
jgi:hypothetical protein